MQLFFHLPYLYTKSNEMARLLITLMLLIPFMVSGQDLIKRTSGEPVKAKVIRIDKDSVIYQLSDRGDTSYIVSKKELQSIFMENGIKLYFSEVPTIDTAHLATIELEAIRDANSYYKGYKTAGTVTLFSGLFFPLFGLIPAIACSTTTPTYDQLNMPDPDKGMKVEYYSAYAEQARKIKSKKVWKNYGIGAGVGMTIRVVYIIALISFVSAISGS